MQGSDGRMKEREKSYLLVSNLYSLSKILGEVLRVKFKPEIIHTEYAISKDDNKQPEAISNPASGRSAI